MGWTGNPSFSPDSFELMYDYSEGVPRKLNVLVSRLLLFGAVEELNRINAQHVRNVIAEIESDRGIDEASLAPLPVEEVVAQAATASAPHAAVPHEWPVASAERAPFAAPATDAAAPVVVAPQDTAQFDALRAQISALETRIAEQDEALRRVLDLLIEWVERDPENAPNPAKSQVWAA